MGLRAGLALVALMAGMAAATAQEIGEGLPGERPYRIKGGVVTVLVSSSGCTTAGYFDMTTRAEDGRTVIELKRKKRDECKAFFPDGVWVAFPAIQPPAPGGSALRIVER